MTLRIIDRETVARLLTYEAAIPLMREAMIALSAGRTKQLLRQVIALGDAAMFGVMPGAGEETTVAAAAKRFDSWFAAGSDPAALAELAG